MSLLSALQVGSNALQANQIGLSVTGHNISNANTPGYVRQAVEFVPAPSQRVGRIQVGLGVQVSGIVQKVDKFLAERLRNAQSDVGSGDAQESVYFELETLIGELSDSDLSTSLNKFFGSIHDIVNQPQSKAVRNVAVLEGQRLTTSLQRLNGQVRDVRVRINNEIGATVDDINGYLKDIAQLNQQILDIEGGTGNVGTAASLRDQRGQKLTELSKLLDVTAAEQPDGTLNILSAGEYLVSGSVRREIEAVQEPSDYLHINRLQIKETGSPLSFASGRLDGLVVARDEILGGFEQQLDELSKALAFEFNRVYSQGQGLVGFQSITSEHPILDPNQALDAAGLPYAPENGNLTLRVRNAKTESVVEHQIAIELNGLDTDTTVDSFLARLNAIDGLSADISSDGLLQINVTDPSLEFSFGEDTSGILAAVGLNTFFSGSTANDIRVRDNVVDNPALFAASLGGIAGDTENALRLANFANTGLESIDGRSISEFYAGIVADVSQGAANTSAVAEGYRVYSNTLESQHLSIAGVNLDEEALKMLSYQRSYQAAARYIQTVNELLDVMLSL